MKSGRGGGIGRARRQEASKGSGFKLKQGCKAGRVGTWSKQRNQKLCREGGVVDLDGLAAWRIRWLGLPLHCCCRQVRLWVRQCARWHSALQAGAACSEAHQQALRVDGCTQMH